MPVPPWIVDGHARWGCRNSHEDWHEEPGDNSTNNSPTWAKRNNSHGFHVAKWNQFRKYSWPCSHFNSELLGSFFDEVASGKGRQFDHSSANSEVIGSWRSYNLQDSHVAQGILVYMVSKNHAHKGDTCFLPKRLKVLFLSPASRAGPSHVMFVRTSMDSGSQDATKIPSALTDSRIHSFTKMITLYMCILKVTIFLSVSLSFFFQCCGNVDVKTRWSLQNLSLDEELCWTSWALWKLLLWVSELFSHTVLIWILTRKWWSQKDSQRHLITQVSIQIQLE